MRKERVRKLPRKNRVRRGCERKETEGIGSRTCEALSESVIIRAPIRRQIYLTLFSKLLLVNTSVRRTVHRSLKKSIH